MPINQRGGSYQAAFSYQGERLRKDFSTKAEAELWMLQTRADLEAGRITVAALKSKKSNPQPEAAATVPTLGTFVQMIYRSRWMDLKSAATALTNATQVAEALGNDRLVSTLCKADSGKIKEHFRAKGVATATVDRKLAALSTIMKEAREHGFLTGPTFRVGLSKQASGRKRVMTPKEEAKMLAWCERWGFTDLYDYIIVSLDSGFRQGEVLKIIAKDVGGDDLWTYDTKNGKNRAVPLTPRAKEVLERRAEGLGPNDKVFPLPPKRIESHWKKLCHGIGIDREVDEDFVPHAMRHTFVTRLLGRGVDIITVKELAGHSTIITTQGYAHTSTEQMVWAIAKLSAASPIAAE